MADFAGMQALDVWYARVDLTAVLNSVHDKVAAARLRKRVKQAASRNVLEDDFPKMVEKKGGEHVIRETPPLIYHHGLINLSASQNNIREAFARYRETLPDDRKVLLDRYQLRDLSLKVVGIGSVGTFCAVMLMMAGNEDPLFLQVKESRPSVLERYVGTSSYPNYAQRVVVGPAPDASGKRSFPRLDTRKGRAAFLHPPAPRHEDEAAGRALQSANDG